MHAEKKILIFLINTLLLYILLLALALTDGQNHRRRNDYTCYTWAGGTFFPVVLLCQFFVLAGNRVWFYILLMYLKQLWCCASFFGSGGKYFLVLHTYLVYNTVVWLCQHFCCGGKVNFVQIFLLNPSFLFVHRNRYSEGMDDGQKTQR